MGRENNSFTRFFFCFFSQKIYISWNDVKAPTGFFISLWYCCSVNNIMFSSLLRKVVWLSCDWPTYTLTSDDHSNHSCSSNLLYHNRVLSKPLHKCLLTISVLQKLKSVFYLSYSALNQKQCFVDVCLIVCVGLCFCRKKAQVFEVKGQRRGIKEESKNVARQAGWGQKWAQIIGRDTANNQPRLKNVDRWREINKYMYFWWRQMGGEGWK